MTQVEMPLWRDLCLWRQTPVCTADRDTIIFVGEGEGGTLSNNITVKNVLLAGKEIIRYGFDMHGIVLITRNQTHYTTQKLYNYFW